MGGFMPFRHFLIISVLLIPFHFRTVWAAPKKLSVTGTLNTQGYYVVLLEGTGRVRATKATNGAFKFSGLSSQAMKNASLVVLDQSGRAAGPVVLSVDKKKRMANLGFSGKSVDTKGVIKLGKIEVKKGFAGLKRNLAKSIVSASQKLIAATTGDGAPIGAASGGVSAVAATRSFSSGIVATDTSSNGIGPRDTDQDGIIDAIDPDSDGDGVPNIADPDFAGNEDATYSSMVTTLGHKLNANISSLASSDIDAIIGGEHIFVISFWFSLPSDSSITGGHVICADTNPYCAPGSRVAVYNGLSESNPSLRGQVWADLNMNGSGFPNLELLTLSFGKAIAGAIEPRRGTTDVRPGDSYLIEYTNSSGTVVSSKLLVLSPYLVTAPALKAAGGVGNEREIDYVDTSSPGHGQSNPLEIGSDGKLSLQFWRPQRLLYSSETPLNSSDRYRDFGYLTYGVNVERTETSSISRQFTCAGFYTGLSSSLSDESGTVSNPYTDMGGNLTPLRDRSGDSVPSTSAFYALTVDLKGCLERAGLSVGTYQIRLQASGEQLSGGSNNVSQVFWVKVN